ERRPWLTMLSRTGRRNVEPPGTAAFLQQVPGPMAATRRFAWKLQRVIVYLYNQIGRDGWHGHLGNRWEEGLRPACVGPGHSCLWLHAADHRACLRRQSDAARPQASGEPALRQGQYS